MSPRRNRLVGKQLPGFPRCAGFSLVELLVVIAVIGLLIAVVLPAVQAVREAARRMECLNNLHQIGIGSLGYHDAYQRFPLGGVEMRTLRTPTGQLRYPNGVQLAWTAYILPYIELQGLAKRIDYKKGYDSPANAKAAAEIVSTYLCPSAARQDFLYQGRAVTDYGGIYGTQLTGTNNPPRGVMLYSQYVRIRDIIDGTSKTLMVSEDCMHPDSMQWINGENVFSVDVPMNTAAPLENDINSKHKGGANGLLADGSARFLSTDMDLSILAAICTRNGKEPVGDF